MKIMMYMIGLLSSMAMAIGFTFSLLQWPGSFPLSLPGLVFFSFVFIPMLAISQYHGIRKKDFIEKLSISFGYASALLFGIAVIFKTMHLQFAEFILLVSMIIFAFGFLPFLFFRIYKKAISL
ncbi:hypothetical protein BH23BAC1_BH23BAC1_18410 [soil metagenome]